MQIEIVTLSQIEKSEWLPLWSGYQTFYKANINEDITQHTWERLVSEDIQHMYGFAAIANSSVVGIVHVIEHDSCWTKEPYAYLQDLYVSESSRGQGIARKLIETVYATAKQGQCDRVYWLTQDSNEIAQKLYDQVAKKTGFIQYRMS